jgi:4'-phosphopantetheinyl transferase EntD
VGVDVEVDRAARPGIAKFVLTPREREALPSSPEGDRLVTLVFSIKESIYKALDPYVARYVGFHEVEVLGPEGQIETPKFMLKGQEGLFEADVWWEFRSGYIFSSARVRRLGGNGARP